MKVFSAKMEKNFTGGTFFPENIGSTEFRLEMLFGRRHNSAYCDYKPLRYSEMDYRACVKGGALVSCSPFFLASGEEKLVNYQISVIML